MLIRKPIWRIEKAGSPSRRDLLAIVWHSWIESQSGALVFDAVSAPIAPLVSGNQERSANAWLWNMRTAK